MSYAHRGGVGRGSLHREISNNGTENLLKDRHSNRFMNIGSNFSKTSLPIRAFSKKPTAKCMSSKRFGHINQGQIQ
jgi:hypothetical protein